MYVKKVLFAITTLLIGAIICTIGVALIKILPELISGRLAESINSTGSELAKYVLLRCKDYFVFFLIGPSAFLSLIFYSIFSGNDFVRTYFNYLIPLIYVLVLSCWTKKIIIVGVCIWYSIGVLLVLFMPNYY